MGNNVSVSDEINIVSSVINYDTCISDDEFDSSIAPKSRECICIDNKSVYDIKANPRMKFDEFNGKKLCVIFCNSYDKTRYALGECALNDGLLTYRSIQQFGYSAYLFHDLSKNDFRKVFKNALRCRASELMIYYIGHGTQVKDRDGDEIDGKDECILCMDGVIIDDDLAKMINSCNNSKRLILISDCCHSGTIFDIPPRDDIITLSACTDDQTAQQDWIDHCGNGIFSYYFWKYIFDNNDNIIKLIELMNVKLKKYKQQIVINNMVKRLL